MHSPQLSSQLSLDDSQSSSDDEEEEQEGRRLCPRSCSPSKVTTLGLALGPGPVLVLEGEEETGKLGVIGRGKLSLVQLPPLHVTEILP